MTREKALEVSRALDDVDGFEAFMDEIYKVVDIFSDTCDLKDFALHLEHTMAQELKRRKAVLEEL